MAPLIADLVPLGSLQRQANPVQICSKDCESDRSSEAIPAVRANPVQAAAFQVVDGGFVAVGALVAQRPSAQIRACALTHSAPASGVDGTKPLIRPWVKDPDGWEEALRQLRQLLPYAKGIPPLGATAQLLEPEAPDASHERLEGTHGWRELHSIAATP